MRKIKNIAIILAVLLVLAFLLTGCSDANGNDPTGSIPPSGDPLTPPPSAPSASAQRPTRPITTTVTLADNNIVISGNGASASGNILTISADGVYEITGTLSDGQIIIDAPDVAKVELVLSGVNITNKTNAAIWCKSCDDFLISLTENTQNIITDASNYTYGDTVNQEPSAAIFSKTDLNIGGTGWLTVNANFEHGIYSKDDLVIEGGGFKVTSAVDAIRGKDSLNILNGRFEINAGGDAFQASSIDGAEFGYLQITGGEYVIKAAGDALQAETSLIISGGTFDITTAGTPAGPRTAKRDSKQEHSFL